MAPDIIFYLLSREGAILGHCSLCWQPVAAIDFDDHARLHGAATMAVASDVPKGL